MLTDPVRGVLLAGLLGTALMMLASRSSPARPETGTSGAPATPAEDSRRAPQSGKAVQTEMRNVDCHASPWVLLNVRRLRGEMHSKWEGRPPVFEDKESFFLRSIPPRSGCLP